MTGVSLADARRSSSPASPVDKYVTTGDTLTLNSGLVTALWDNTLDGYTTEKGKDDGSGYQVKDVVAKCEEAPPTCSIQAPTDFTDTTGWMIGTNAATTCEWMKHLCEPMQKCECGEQGGEKKCPGWPYLMKGGLQNEHNHPAANCAVCRGFKIPLVPGMQNGVYDGTVWSDYYHSDEATKVWTGDWACPAGVDDCDWPTGKH
jgi:hypothetical protein